MCQWKNTIQVYACGKEEPLPHGALCRYCEAMAASLAAMQAWDRRPVGPRPVQRCSGLLPPHTERVYAPGICPDARIGRCAGACARRGH